MTQEKKPPGPKPELFKVPLPFKEAVKAALETNPPTKRRKKPKRKRASS